MTNQLGILQRIKRLDHVLDQGQDQDQGLTQKIVDLGRGQDLEMENVSYCLFIVHSLKNENGYLYGVTT